MEELNTTFPNFHNGKLRVEEFKLALKTQNPNRLEDGKYLIHNVLEKQDILLDFDLIVSQLRKGCSLRYED